MTSVSVDVVVAMVMLVVDDANRGHSGSSGRDHRGGLSVDRVMPRYLWRGYLYFYKFIT